eukprot:962344-Rhodomonas_salina.2
MDADCYCGIISRCSIEKKKRLSASDASIVVLSGEEAHVKVSFDQVPVEEGKWFRVLTLTRRGTIRGLNVDRHQPR